ncbi:6-phosphogluconolactonase [Hymenobacter roseosalivarius DSM 11622]|uniref:6-phosphogluconolactonase n=1 Tax=Hymenobacter roseosalivarius DSM 11622 TaxID=645990 RepID=A0A1W1VHA9_9BACT|nr:6-phosphogluconolactonase [Hymenobacter roseosalivarius]SMB92623.1 6-phosphogluconolactonase [Hymenobacter roseosalivarius DSM 11622]
MALNNNPQLHIYPTPDEVLASLADYFVELANQAIATHGRFSVALSGGNSPKKLYELLASSPYRSRVIWEKVDFFFGDERYVPHTDPESNYLLAKKTLFAPLHIASAQVFAVDTALSPAEAARRYTQTIEHYFGSKKARFDLVLLGLGDNSHTASLFPHTTVLQEAGVGAKEVFVEEKQAYRITLTAPLINQAQAVAFLVYGTDKAAAVQRVLTKERNVKEFPAQLIAPASGELHWFLDADAAAEVQKLKGSWTSLFG